MQVNLTSEEVRNTVIMIRHCLSVWSANGERPEAMSAAVYLINKFEGELIEAHKKEQAEKVE